MKDRGLWVGLFCLLSNELETCVAFIGWHAVCRKVFSLVNLKASVKAHQMRRPMPSVIDSKRWLKRLFWGFPSCIELIWRTIVNDEGLEQLKLQSVIVCREKEIWNHYFPSKGSFGNVVNKKKVYSYVANYLPKIALSKPQLPGRYCPAAHTTCLLLPALFLANLSGAGTFLCHD